MADVKPLKISTSGAHSEFASTDTVSSANGGTGHGVWTPGSIPFGYSDGTLIESNAQLYWDATNIMFGVGSGANPPTSTLNSKGSFGVTHASKTANYTATATDCVILVDASGGAVQITLPDAGGIGGRLYIVKKTDAVANNVTVEGTGGDTIDGAANKVWNTTKLAYTFMSDNVNWQIVGSY